MDLKEDPESSTPNLRSNRSSVNFEEDISRISRHLQETSSLSQEHSGNTSNKSPSNTSNKKMGLLMATGHKPGAKLESPGFFDPKEACARLPHAELAAVHSQLFPEPQLSQKLLCDEMDSELIDIKDPYNDDLMNSGTFLEVVDGTPDPKKPIPDSSQFGYEMSSLQATGSCWGPAQSGHLAASITNNQITKETQLSCQLDQSLHDRCFVDTSN